MPECPASSMVAGQAEWIWVPRLGRPARSSSRSLFGRMASGSSGSGVGGRDGGGDGALRFQWVLAASGASAMHAKATLAVVGTPNRAV
jgi:hypothetical protein